MSLGNYLKEKILFVALELFFLVFIFFLGYVLHIKKEYSIMILVLLILGNGILFLADYPKRKGFYRKLLTQLDQLDQKYLITELVRRPEFLEGQILCDVLYDTDKSMQERIHAAERTQKEFREYIELWIHEIKLPISSLSLMNYNRDTDLAAQKRQIQKLTFLAEQILYLSRADNSQKDYLLKEVRLESLVNKVVVNQKELLIGHAIAIDRQDLDRNVITDAKWMEFILGQIVSNSIKYTKDGSDRKISFYARLDSEKTTLVVEDNGIGVRAEDLPRVFEKTFTGRNGRKVEGSTGMGLYICQKLCHKLGHSIRMESEEGSYTRIVIEFGRNNFYLGQ